VLLACLALPTQWKLNFEHKSGNVTHFVFRFVISISRLSEKLTILPRICGLSPLFSLFRQKCSLFLISFSPVQVDVASPSSSSDFFSFLPIPRVVMAPKRYSITSSPVIP
jgi:hypothetical protein